MGSNPTPPTTGLAVPALGGVLHRSPRCSRYEHGHLLVLAVKHRESDATRRRTRDHAELAQLGEHNPYKFGVRGSSPLFRTKNQAVQTYFHTLRGYG